MKKQTLLSDLLLLLKLYAPKDCALFVFDPFEKMEVDVDFPLNNMGENAFKVLVSFADEIVSFKGMPLEEFDIVIDFGKSSMTPSFKKKQLSYINNPNGGMRWLYSEKNRKASFLNFYNTATTKAKFIATSIQTLMMLGLGVFVRSGRFSIYHQANLKINELVSSVDHDDYSVFMGTNDANRTILLELNTNGISSHFLKVPTNEKSMASIVNEREQLSYVDSNEFTSFSVPKIELSNFRDVLISENLKFSNSHRSNEMTPLHYGALNEMAMKTVRFHHLKSTSYWDQIMDNMYQLRRSGKNNDLLVLLNQIKEELKEVSTVYTSLTHGDFTPWNMYVSKDKLSVYDWEMSQKNVPLLHDLFHFHFQTGVLSDKVAVAEIKQGIDESCQNEEIVAIIKTYGIDIDTYFKFYLLKTVSQYLVLFNEQVTLSIQHEWLLDAWRETLKVIVAIPSEEIQRISFIKNFNVQLQRTAHAFLKFSEEKLENLQSSSDIDVLVLKKDIKSIINYCENQVNIKRVNTHQKSFMTTIELYFNDDSFLSIDLINQFKRKGKQMLSAKKLLVSAIPNEHGVTVPNIKLDFEYCFLFYTLNGSSIPSKYKSFYGGKNQETNNAIFNYIDQKYGLSVASFDDLFNYDSQLRLKSISKLKESTFNLNQLKNNFNYLVDTLKDLLFKRGMVITFSGVDGAGKTTIIDRVKERLASKYRKEVVLLRHRPGILPILSAIKHGKEEAEHIASVTMPRKGKNNNVLSSLLRFAYYFTDYMIGQVYVYFKYVLRGKIVLYDRYYFDFINDAKRSNIQLNRGFLKSLYRFVFKPKLNFFLYADAETILARKKEMIAPEIDLLTKQYKNLFGQMSKQYKNSQYTIIENKELEVTLSKIMTTYLRVA